MDRHGNRRDYFRLRYPPSMPGTVVLDGESYPLIELSLNGLRIECTRAFAHFEKVSGEIQTHDGTCIEFSGRFGRRRRNQIVIVDVVGITQAYVNAEERRLMKHFVR